MRKSHLISQTWTIPELTNFLSLSLSPHQGGGGGTGRFARPSDFSTWSNCAKELWNLCAQQVGEDGTDLRGAVSKLGNKYSFAEIKQAAEMIQDNGLGFETQEDFMSLTL